MKERGVCERGNWIWDIRAHCGKQGNEKSRILLQKPLGKAMEMESLLPRLGEEGKREFGHRRRRVHAAPPPLRIHPAPRSSFPALTAGDSKVKHN